ncbi:MAG TPA: SpoIIE family protein phosphatase [Candidatus Sulfotelmatobacter sp.]|nr:SpoIIE family protein phosphatase [Candidatus Sulfotelmatobacter sp.]
MRVDVASHASHGRKYGPTFAHTWRAADGATIGALAAVLAGQDPIVVADLLRTGAHALLTSRKALGTTLVALDTIVRKHAHEHRDDDLAAAMLLIAIDPAGEEITYAGAGAAQMHVAVVDGAGALHPLHGHAVALGTGIDGPVESQHVRLRRDDAIVAATVPFPAGWWAAGNPTAESFLARAGHPEASVLLVLPA